MTQLSLIGYRPPVAAPKASEQDKQLTRVERGIARYVLDFCRANVGQEFVVTQLQSYVTSRHGAAPASPDRILRSLRSRGVLEYEVVDRSRALYRVTRCP